MENNQKKFNERYNKTLIELIKNKLFPLQKPRQRKMLPQVVTHSKTNSLLIKQTNTSFPSLPSAKISSLHSDKENTQANLLQRVKQYLQNKRRQNHMPQEKTSLEPYLQIFQKPIQNVGRAKRQSIELNFLQIERLERHDRALNNKQGLGFVQKEIKLNQQECSFFNAKIRRKLNHKKLVDLNRRN